MRHAFRTALLALVLAAPMPAAAHPHVWVTTKAELVFGGDGKVAAVRHAWTFDEAYTAYLTQGLDKNANGTLEPAELADLARENTESLADFDYFTHVKAGGAKQAFSPPQEPAMSVAKGQATLTFLLPLKAPAAVGKAFALEVYDPSFFVSFLIDEASDAVRLASAPKGCLTTITRPKPIEAGGQQRLSESFFNALTAASDFGASFANRAVVSCP